MCDINGASGEQLFCVRCLSCACAVVCGGVQLSGHSADEPSEIVNGTISVLDYLGGPAYGSGQSVTLTHSALRFKLPGTGTV